jgi:hypothetical protein
MKRCSPSLVGLIFLSLAAGACADADIEPSNTVVSGFGTLGGVYNSNEKHGFLRDLGQETTPGRQYSWKTDTRLGVQVAHTFSPQWQVVGQVLLRDQAEQTLDSVVSRAFVSYRPTANLHVRFGRMADATFLMSDYLDVGYTYPWVRPPIESYGLVVPHAYDGVDATYSIPDSAGVWRIKGLFGRVKAAMPSIFGGNYILETNDAKGLALIREQGPLKMRIGYSTLHLKNPCPIPGQLSSGLSQMAADPMVNAFFPAVAGEAHSLSEDVSGTQGARVGYTSVGIVYDDGKWVAQVEANKLSAQTKLAPRGLQAFASLGYRIGDFLPYVMVSGSRAPAIVKAGTSWAALGSDAVLLQNGALTAINSTRMAQNTLSLGMRWDFDSRAAFKLQWDQVHVRDSGWRAWSTPIGGDSAAGRANLLSATIDFVF